MYFSFNHKKTKDNVKALVSWVSLTVLGVTAAAGRTTGGGVPAAGAAIDEVKEGSFSFLAIHLKASNVLVIWILQAAPDPLSFWMVLRSSLSTT